MEGSFAAVTWRQTHSIDQEESALWTESENEYKNAMKAAIVRRINGTDVFTDNQLNCSVELLDSLRAQKCKCTGDLSPSAPAIVVDGERPNTDDADRRQTHEYLHQIVAATPIVDIIPMAPAVDVRRGNVWGNVCVTGMAQHVLSALFLIESKLRAFRLSETPHHTMEAFIEKAGLVQFISKQETFYLFGVYAQYGVTCEFDSDFVLQNYSFSSGDGVSSRSHATSELSVNTIL